MSLMLPEDILVSAVRYALGRHSYVVIEVATTVSQVWPRLTEKTRSVILQDLEDHLGRKPLWVQQKKPQAAWTIDDKVWSDLRDELLRRSNEWE